MLRLNNSTPYLKRPLISNKAHKYNKQGLIRKMDVLSQNKEGKHNYARFFLDYLKIKKNHEFLTCFNNTC